MPLRRLDHVNIRTSRLAEMVDWYARVLGLEPGPRPDFGFGGAWLYCEGLPIVHLVESRREHRGEDPKIEHFAIAADGMAEFLARLRRLKVPYQLGVVPGAAFGIRQVNIHDPDGNHIHVDFAKSEPGDVEDYDGS